MFYNDYIKVIGGLAAKFVGVLHWLEKLYPTALGSDLIILYCEFTVGNLR